MTRVVVEHAVRSTNDALYTPRGMIADGEGTRDPIFLFQYRKYVYIEASFSAMEDAGFRYNAEDIVWENDNGPLSDAEAVERGFAAAEWETEHVFGTRAESDSYGERRSYDYTNGWRTYCVCAEGKLAELLIRHWD